MNKRTNIIIILIISSLLMSCTVEKRRYNRGFNVEWFALNNKKDESTKPLKKVNVAKYNSSEIEVNGLTKPNSVMDLTTVNESNYFASEADNTLDKSIAQSTCVNQHSQEVLFWHEPVLAHSAECLSAPIGWPAISAKSKTQGTCTQGVLLIILHTITAIIGIAVAIAGVIGIVFGVSLILSLIGIGVGAEIVYLSIRGIIKLAKWCKED
jgi:hypothetical protein